MGKVTGFMEYERIEEGYAPVAERKTHYREFVSGLIEADAKIQSARCMDCGTPFCNSGCPVNNVIPDFNDLVYRADWKNAYAVLDSTNNFPEFTGRICPAPCEAACTLNVNDDPVGIKSIEHAIIDRAWAEGWVLPQPAAVPSGKTVAVVGSGPAGLAAAQQLARAGHAVTVFEKNGRIGGLLRYGIPDFKMEKGILDQRMTQMRAEGVVFETKADVGGAGPRAIRGADLLARFDAVVLALGARVPRDLPMPGRDLEGVMFAMDFLVPQNMRVAGGAPPAPGSVLATGKHVVVIGGGDTGSDCVGTSNRHGALSIAQLELLPKPPLTRMPDNPWPAWPLVLRTSSSQEEGCARDFAIMTKRFVADASGTRVASLEVVDVVLNGGAPQELPGTEREIPCDLALLAMGFTGPERVGIVEQLGLPLDARGNVITTSTGATSVPKIFASGDVSRGQSLVVWAIADGRRVAAGVDAQLRAIGLRATG